MIEGLLWFLSFLSTGLSCWYTVSVRRKIALIQLDMNRMENELVGLVKELQEDISKRTIHIETRIDDVEGVMADAQASIDQLETVVTDVEARVETIEVEGVGND